jgi:hypothetical protein
MPITKEDLESLKENMETLETALYEIERLLETSDKNLYKRWKAYGKHVTSEFVSMGPSLPEVIEKLENDVVEDEEETDNDEEEKPTFIG